MTPQHDIEELFNLIDQHTVSYTQLDEKFGNWHKYGVVDRESLLRELADYCQKQEQARIQSISDKLVELGIPVLDYNADDSKSEIGRYLQKEYDELSNQQSIETKEK